MKPNTRVWHVTETRCHQALSWQWLLQGSVHLHCFSACSSWPTMWILTMVITRPTLTNLFWPAATLSMFTLQLCIRRRNANTCHRQPRRHYWRQEGPRPTFCARPTIKRTSSLTLPLPARPSSSVLFFGRLQYRSFLDDSNTVWPSGDSRHNLQVQSSLCWFIFDTSLQSSTDIVCYGSVLFSVSV